MVRLDHLSAKAGVGLGTEEERGQANEEVQCQVV